MTLFTLSYALLWALAIALVPVCAVIMYLLVNLKLQVDRTSQSGVLGHSLIGSELARIFGIEISTKEAGHLSEFLGERNVVLALSPFCGTCRGWLKELKLNPSYGEDMGMTFVALCMGSEDQCQSMTASACEGLPLLSVDLEQQDANPGLVHVGYPAALLVDSSGVVLDVRHPPSIGSLKKTWEREGSSISGASSSVSRLAARGIDPI